MRYFWIFLLLIILATGGVYAYTLKKQAQKLTPRITGVKLAEDIEKIDFENLTLKDLTEATGKLAQLDIDIEIEIKNPSTRNFTLHQIDLTLTNESNGAILARIRQPLESSVIVARDSNTKINVPIRLNTLPLLEFIFGGENAFQNFAKIPLLLTGGFGGFGKTMRVKGFARVQQNVFAIPINEVIKI